MATKTNRNPLEARYHQMRKYMQIAIVGIIICCVLMGVNLVKLQQNEAKAINNASQQANVTKNSDICKTFPKEPLCLLAKKISKDPKQEIPPNATQGLQGVQGIQGVKGPAGPIGPMGSAGLGVKTFNTGADGHLMVTFSDGTTKDLGYIVGPTGPSGPAGLIGATGAAGRGITATAIADGQLVVSYTDGTSQIIGNVVGPKGETGATGATGPAGTNGPSGTNGKDGVSITDVSVEDDGTVNVSYSDGTTATAGKIADTTKIDSITCVGNKLTVKLNNDTEMTGENVQCVDTLPIIPSAPKAPVTP